MAANEWREGGCCCGGVRYRVRGDAVWKGGCTCSTCVKMHGAPYVVWAGFDRRRYEVVKGTLTAFRSSPYAMREFCPRCGSTLTYAKDARGEAKLEKAARLVYVAVATLDRPEEFPPDEVVHTRDKIPWLHLDAEAIPLREFVSPIAGDLQFGGIDQGTAHELARRHLDREETDDG